MYCACQAKGSRGPAAATAPQLLQKALCTAPATQKGSAEALCTAPARRKAAAGQRRPPRCSSARKLCVLRLPRKREVRRLYVLRLPGKRQPRASGGHRAAAPPGSSVYCAGMPRKREVRRLKCGRSVYCACQAKGSRGPAGHRAAAPPESSIHCACHAKGKCGGSVYPPRRSSSRKLYVLRLPRTREVRRLCVLRLPGKRRPRASGGHRAAAPPGSSVYCACHAKGKCRG